MLSNRILLSLAKQCRVSYSKSLSRTVATTVNKTNEGNASGLCFGMMNIIHWINFSLFSKTIMLIIPFSFNKCLIIFFIIDLSSEQQEIRNLARRLARNELLPRAKELDRTGEVWIFLFIHLIQYLFVLNIYSYFSNLILIYF